MNSTTLSREERLQPVIEPPYGEVYWVACLFFITSSFAVILYMLIVLIRFASVVLREPGNKLTGRRAILLYYLCVASVVLALFRNVCNLAVVFTGWQSDHMCRTAVNASYVLYALCLFFVFLFLWLRQNMFYRNPLLSQIINPFAILTSWFLLLFLIVGTALFIVFHMFPQLIDRTFQATPSGCRDVSVQKQFVPSALIYCTVLTHILLLVLLSFPLLSHSTRPYSCNETKVVSDSGSTGSSDVSGEVIVGAKYNKSEQKAQEK